MAMPSFGVAFVQEAFLDLNGVAQKLNTSQEEKPGGH
jgi:hypothetical protein